MGKILQQLYRGDLCPAENTIRGNAEYDALTRQSMDDFNRFTDGFRIGAGVMCEVFYENAAERN